MAGVLGLGRPVEPGSGGLQRLIHLLDKWAWLESTLTGTHPGIGPSVVVSCSCPDVSSTRVSRRVNAPRALVSRALLDTRAVAVWRVPTGMTGQVLAFDPREDGAFRVSLTYDAPTGTGKTTAHTDTYHGRFVELVPDEPVVEVVEFETADPALRGEMTITTVLTGAGGAGVGTDLVSEHDGLPPGVSTADNEAGGREALGKLAALVEAG